MHKQVINRMLEPWSHINVLVTATEWDNFFNLRLHPDAQPEIHELAIQMKLVMEMSEPVKRKYHIPFLTESEWARLTPANLWMMFSISAARCARLSYLTHGDVAVNLVKDLKLADRLRAQKHMSPFEHQATGIKTPPSVGRENPNTWRRNFFGWKPFRMEIEEADQVTSTANI